ncbi:hypothetical protein [Streptosporangium canum]|uniref:hypothetical protein n=1 Tax=Streptosporangium canum TaxID=324952 RepID=UPI0037938BB1
MSSFLFYSDHVIELPVGQAHALPADLCSYQEHIDHGAPVVLAPDSAFIEEGYLWPDAYRVTINKWGAEDWTPVYARERALPQPLVTDWMGLDYPADDATRTLREELHDPAFFAFLAGRTAQCCGRLSELAIFDGTGRPIFDEALAPRDGETPWPCAQRHPRRGSGRSFAQWAHQLFLVLLYRNRNDALKMPSMTAQGGKRRSQLVVWGTDVLQVLHREYAFVRERHLNHEMQKVEDPMGGLDICDLQMADVLWRGSWPGGVAELAHLDGATTGEDCRMMHVHLNLLKQKPKITVAKTGQMSRPSTFRTAPPPSFVMATASLEGRPSDRKDQEIRDVCTIVTGPSPAHRKAPPAVQEPLPVTPEELLRHIPGLDHEGATDVVRTVIQRREQSKLRRRLLKGRTSAMCDLCGRTLPAAYLRAAHIKRREDADDAERHDLAIAMLACVLGCDALFEEGEVYVDEHGVVRARCTPTGPSTDLPAVVTALDGLHCAAHSPQSEPYFRAHRQSHGHNAGQ